MLAIQISMLACIIFSSAFMASASPFPSIPQALPHGVSRLALDESSNRVIAYDASGNLLGKFNTKYIAPQKRAPSSCVALSKDELMKLPGWKALEAEANKNWGKGSRNIVTNDKDFMDRPAQVCVDDTPAIITKSDKEDCSQTSQSLGGQLVGTDGTVTLSYKDGTEYTSSNTVTKESSLAVGVTVSAGFDFAKIFSAGVEVSTTSTFTNTISNTETFTRNSESEASIQMKAPKGEKCHLNFKHKSCNIRGSGKVRFIATGFVWFEYNDKVDGHYKWALQIESVVPKIEDRSSYAEFKSLIQSTTKSEYKGTCS